MNIKTSDINIGLVGRGGVGKTTLLSAISKVLSDDGKAKFIKYNDLKDENYSSKEGLIINATSISFKGMFNTYNLFEFETTYDLMKTMISKDIRIDGLLLVVTAEEGSSSIEHQALEIGKLLGIKNLVTFISKTDGVDLDMLEFTEFDIEAVIDDLEFDSSSSPIIKGSAERALNDYADVIDIETLINSIEDAFDYKVENDSDIEMVDSFEAGFYIKSHKEGLLFGFLKEDFVLEINGKVIDANIMKLDGEMLMLGDYCNVKVNLTKYVNIKKGDTFVAKQNGKTVALGIVKDL